MKVVAITGASGFVATELIRLLAQWPEDYYVYAISTHVDSIIKNYNGYNNVECLDLEQFAGKSDIHVDIVLHCAFARTDDGKQIAASLQYTKALLGVAREMKIESFVYISSQSVYDDSFPSPRGENNPVAPKSIYALGKYAGEMLVEAALVDCPNKYTCIRLASVCTNARFLNVFVKNAMEGIPIKVMGGRQKCSFIDVRDVALALKKVIDLYNNVELEPIYNLGTNIQRDILSLAGDVKRIFKEQFGKEIEVEQQPSDLFLDAGMDATLFSEAFDWQPQYGYDDMIKALIEYNTNN